MAKSSEHSYRTVAHASAAVSPAAGSPQQRSMAAGGRPAWAETGPPSSHRELADRLRNSLSVFSAAADLLPRMSSEHADALQLSEIMRRQIRHLTAQLAELESGTLKALE